MPKPFEFKERLSTLRKNAGITQADAAKLMQVSRTTYASYEQGNAEPNLQLLIKLADLFQVTTDFLLGRDEANKNIFDPNLQRSIFEKTLNKKIEEATAEILSTLIEDNLEDIKDKVLARIDRKE